MLGYITVASLVLASLLLHGKSCDFKDISMISSSRNFSYVRRRCQAVTPGDQPSLLSDKVSPFIFQQIRALLLFNFSQDCGDGGIAAALK